MAYTYTEKVNSKGNSAIQFRMGYEIASQNTGAAPSSVVNVVLQTRRTNTSTTNKQPASTSMTIDSESYTQATNYNVSGYTQNTWYTIMTKSGITVLHDPATGEKTLPLAFSINLSGTSALSASGEWSVTLPTIPMGSTLTLNAASYPIGSSNPTVTATITGHNTSYYHKLLFYIDGNSTAIVTKDVGVVSSSTMQVTATQSLAAGTWLPLIPNSVTGNCTCILRTYTTSGRTVQVGVDSVVNFTIVCGQYPTLGAVSVAPVCTTNNWASGKSSAKITAASASGIQGSTISTYEFLQNGAVIKTYSSGSLPSGWTINATGWTTASALNAGSYTFGVRITDSRGLSTTGSASAITVPAYSQPSISSISIYRSNSSGTAQQDGTSISVIATATAITTGNSITSFKCYIKASSDSNYTDKGSITNGTRSTYNNYYATTSYSVKLEAIDKFGSTSTYTTTVPTASYTMDFKVGGLGIGIGKVAETDNLLDSAWAIKSAKDIEADGCFKGLLNGGTHIGKAIFVPRYGYSTLGLTSGNNLAFWSAWMAKMVELYPNYTQTIFEGLAFPVDGGIVLWYCANTSQLSSGLPQYSSGVYIPYNGNGSATYFGTSAYTAWVTTGKVVTDGAQTFAGEKTFTGIPELSSRANGGTIRFSSTGHTGTSGGTISMWEAKPSGLNVYTPYAFYFAQRSYVSSTGEILEYYEQYKLPNAVADLTANKTYDILTSKSAVTIAQGGTGQGAPSTVSTGVVSSVSGATLSVQKASVWGKTVTLYLEFSAGSIAAGGDITATVASTYRPAFYGSGVGYYGQRAFVAQVDANGSMVIRNTGAAASITTNPLRVTLTYIIA